VIRREPPKTESLEGYYARYLAKNSDDEEYLRKLRFDRMHVTKTLNFDYSAYLDQDLKIPLTKINAKIGATIWVSLNENVERRFFIKKKQPRVATSNRLF
jgi:hypothetical protein